jgi:hypothetical protein
VRLENGKFLDLTFCKKQVRMVKENLWVAQPMQKSYADHRRRQLSFSVGEFVYLKVSYERFAPFQGTRQARTKIYCTIPDNGDER